MEYINVVKSAVIYTMFYIWAINFKVPWQEKKNHTNFRFDCNSISVIYLLTCERCRNHYIGSTVKKFLFRFNQYKSSIKLLCEERWWLEQEKLIECFLPKSQWNWQRYFRSNNWSLRSKWPRKTRVFLDSLFRYNVS